MNPETLVGVCAYEGDQHQVIAALGQYLHHECPTVVFSPEDSPAHVVYPGVDRVFCGRRAYIGQESLDRQVMHLQHFLKSPFNYFLLHDSDSFCLSKEIPSHLYKCSTRTLWANVVTEPRPHVSPYPKVALQPPYFISRKVAEAMVSVAPTIRAHEVTPYIDWAMLAWACEAGLLFKPFTSLEHTPRTEIIFSDSDPWRTLEFRIKYMGAAFMHPIKTVQQLELCVKAREFYERN